MPLKLALALRPAAQMPTLRLAADRPLADAAAQAVIGVRAAATAERVARIIGRRLELAAAADVAAVETKLLYRGGGDDICHEYTRRWVLHFGPLQRAARK
jgi:hypothetical protein